jgi:DNA-binding beta-propeller fold protein YncE
MKTHALFIFAFLIGSQLLHAQTVTTFTDGTPDDAIAMDSNGNIYASNFTGDTVFKFTPSGDVSSFITGLDTPNGLAFDSSENLYVCDWNANTIYRYDINGTQTGSIFIPGNPSGIIKAFDNDDMIYTRYAASANTINRVTPNGVITQISAAPQLNGPVGLAYDENGVLYVANYNDREIYRVMANGDLQFVALVGQSSNLGFIAYAQGMLWATVLGEHKIYAVNPNGIDDVTLFAGSTAGSADGTIDNATFNRPNGILFNDAEDTMYITDFGTKNLRIISDVVLGTTESDLKKTELILHPNPATDAIHVHVSIPVVGDYSIVVHDILGKEMIMINGFAESSEILETIDVSQWSNGTYLIEVAFNGYSIGKKIVK